MGTSIGASGVSYPDGTTQATAGAWSQASNGYRKLPDGTIIQWGTTASNNVALSFPIAFPTACVSVVSSPTPTSAGGAYYQIQNAAVSRTGFTPYTSSNLPSSGGMMWMAVGY